jgi:hypothetical protein
VTAARRTFVPTVQKVEVVRVTFLRGRGDSDADPTRQVVAYYVPIDPAYRVGPPLSEGELELLVEIAPLDARVP